MRKSLLALGLGVACVAAAAQAVSTQSPVTPAPAAAPAVFTPTVTNVPMPALTAEEQKAIARLQARDLASARQHADAIAQRAVRDREEQGFREPTAAEAAALALPSSEAVAEEVALPMGGFAVRTDASGVSFAVATIGKDGLTVGHQSKGARRDQ